AAREGVIAAGIQDDYVDAGLRTVHLRQYKSRIDGFILDVFLSLHLRINRNEIIDALNLYAVTGVIKQGHATVPYLRTKFANRALHAVLIEVLLIDHVETGPAQRLSHVASVVDRIF